MTNRRINAEGIDASFIGLMRNTFRFAKNARGIQPIPTLESIHSSTDTILSQSCLNWSTQITQENRAMWRFAAFASTIAIAAPITHTVGTTEWPRTISKWGWTASTLTTTTLWTHSAFLCVSGLILVPFLITTSLPLKKASLWLPSRISWKSITRWCRLACIVRGIWMRLNLYTRMLCSWKFNKTWCRFSSKNTLCSQSL